MPFRAIIGQDRALTLLRRALRTGRLAQAYLFVGPEGVGKKTTALALAQAVNCREEREQDACGTCSPCRKIQHGLHPDVRVVEPEAGKVKLGVDQVRELLTEAAMKPYEGRRKVFILEKADRMTEEGENALLKTLEEPVGETLLILVTSNPSALLPTIISRCQEVRFPPIPPEPLAAYLSREKGVDPLKARLLARLSGGSLGLALRMEDDGLLETRDRVVETVFQAVQQGDMAILELAETLAKDKETLDEALGSLQSYARDLVAWKLTGRRDLLVNEDHAEEINRRSAPLSEEGLRSLYAAIQEARNGIGRNWNARLTLEVMLFKIREVISPSGEGVLHA